MTETKRTKGGEVLQGGPFVQRQDKDLRPGPCEMRQRTCECGWELVIDAVVMRARRGGRKCRVFEVTWQADKSKRVTLGGWLPCAWADVEWDNQSARRGLAGPRAPMTKCQRPSTGTGRPSRLWTGRSTRTAAALSHSHSAHEA